MSLTTHARQRRKHMTREEVIVWVQLKHLNAPGFDFRRQAPSNGYIPDFAELNCKLMIEIDGSQHNEPAQMLQDSKRGVMDQILGAQILGASPAAPAPLRAPSPKGEDSRC